MQSKGRRTKETKRVFSDKLIILNIDNVNRGTYPRKTENNNNEPVRTG